MRLKQILQRGLEATAAMWPPIRKAYGWVHAVAQVLDNPEALPGAQVRQRLQGVLGAMVRWQSQAGELQPAVAHFVKVTRSYWPGLFHCYDVPGLPRTNNDLEHFFGTSRYQVRRITGRKTAPASWLIRGEVRLVAAIATQQHTFTPEELVPADLSVWQVLRKKLETRNHQRVLQRRFRHDPKTYLENLEEALLKATLPP